MVNGYDVTNTYSPEQTSITVTKAWADNNDQDGLRPESVTVKLLADGQETNKTLTLSSDNNWQGTFSGLDKYREGKEISYSVAEVSVTGYETEISGSSSTGFTITNTPHLRKQSRFPAPRRGTTTTIRTVSAPPLSPSDSMQTERS